MTPPVAHDRARVEPYAVLVVDDEPDILDLAGAYLRGGGFVVRTATTGSEALTSVAASPPDLVVLDLGLPDIDGERVCGTIRARSALPVVMLTARSSETERLRGLEAGADDYLVKPFSPRELVARVRTILRRTAPMTARSTDAISLSRGRLTIDTIAHAARLDGGPPLPLTAAEARLLSALATHPGRVFTRFELLVAIQGPDMDGMERTVDVNVMRLRRKLRAAGADAVAGIATVHAVGYRLDEVDPS